MLPKQQDWQDGCDSSMQQYSSSTGATAPRLSLALERSASSSQHCCVPSGAVCFCLWSYGSMYSPTSSFAILQQQLRQENEWHEFEASFEDKLEDAIIPNDGNEQMG
eukprot:m.161614 g.161614  ORF g.161614 m.161614 type:complete len:107 (-) comp10288_c2_seq1:43-363(-)